MRRAVVTLALLVGCTGGTNQTNLDLPDGGDTPDLAPGVISKPDAGTTSPSGVAPQGTIPGEQAAKDGANPVALAAGDEVVFRVETKPFQHVGFGLTFATGAQRVSMTVERWDGTGAAALGTTDAGGGVRFLAVLDASEPRTFWVRITAPTAPLAATLTVTRTAFTDGIKCSTDCARLLQLPLANDPVVDGYDHDGGTIFRYWFGRRDLLMMVRAAARRGADAGMKPIHPYDFSQWDGLTPGADVGSLRHASHQRGKDVDLSLFGTDGRSIWRSFCTTQSTSDGRVCVAGTRRDFDGERNARMYAPFLETGRVTMSFLDRELIPAAVTGAKTGNTQGFVDKAIVPLYSDGKHLQHWPNHDNHIHVRVSETTYGTGATPPFAEEPFEAP